MIIMGGMKKTSGKRRRSVRCTICTPHRYLGNSARRYKRKDKIEMRDTARLETEPADFPGTVENEDEFCESAYCDCSRCEGLR